MNAWRATPAKSCVCAMARLPLRHIVIGDETVKPLVSISKWRFVPALLLCVLGLAAVATSAAGYPAAPGNGSTAPSASPTPKVTTTPAPAPTQPGVPPIIINIPPALGNNAPPQAPVDNSAPVLSIT